MQQANEEYAAALNQASRYFFKKYIKLCLTKFFLS